MGSVVPMAHELSRIAGVVEPLQSKFDIAGLIAELRDQLTRVGTGPMTLIGHAWGAWLSGLYAASYPDDVRQVVMVGCPPLDVEYARRVVERRRLKMTQGEWVLFNGLLNRLDKPNENRNWLMEQLRVLLDKTDHYDLIHSGKHRFGKMPVNGDMFVAVWAEAEVLCESGELLRRFKEIRCPLYMIHGDYDPRPMDGVTVPLQANNVPFKRYILPKCGHIPFREKHAAGPFYEILEEIIRGRAGR